ncbi:SUGP1 protein, partial [Calonectris borealis]|nr:SUGP1 protein [Calonectris borealis]
TVQDLKGLGYEKGKPVGLVGVTELSEAQKKQLKEQQEMQQMYDMIMKHKRAMQEMQMMWEKAIQQHQHGYDSDEEVDSELGTWEHQLRRMEMDKTRGEGSFFPSQGRTRVMICLGSTISDVLRMDKKVLLQMERNCFRFWSVWSEGMGGRPVVRQFCVPPISEVQISAFGGQRLCSLSPNRGTTAVDGAGFGIDRPAELTKEDDEYEAFRKRMMLAYRFRPNPLVRWSRNQS